MEMNVGGATPGVYDGSVGSCTRRPIRSWYTCGPALGWFASETNDTAAASWVGAAWWTMARRYLVPCSHDPQRSLEKRGLRSAALARAHEGWLEMHAAGMGGGKR